MWLFFGITWGDSRGDKRVVAQSSLGDIARVFSGRMRSFSTDKLESKDVVLCDLSQSSDNDIIAIDNSLKPNSSAADNPVNQALESAKRMSMANVRIEHVDMGLLNFRVGFENVVWFMERLGARENLAE
eukprot:TRINITY_DN5531_c0_g2_i6.p1 TRINITY_DN5531_c0_g2~~TRINITY_DN5531_c0_g2_i6.p1  ORF type:complete len:129 (-),score=28.87 TRINITY_DN5531_c0_g2_i6:9-395(-)